MKQKKRTCSLTSVVLYGLAAAIWIVNCVCALSYGQMGLLRFANAAGWSAAFAAQICRYRRSRTQSAA